MDRRLFLKLLISSYFLPIKGFTNGGTDTLLVGGTKKKANFLVSINLDSKVIEKIPVDFKIHDVILNPSDPNEVGLVGQWLSSFCTVNLKSKKVIKKFEIKSPSEKFVGHGFYSLDGKNIFLSAAKYEGLQRGVPGEGKFYGLNGNLEIIDEFPSFGLEPHDCILLNNTIIVFNASFSKTQIEFDQIEPSIAFINLEKKELIKKIDLKGTQNLLAHFHAKNDKEIFGVGAHVVSKSKLSPLIMMLKDNKTELNLEEQDGSSPYLSVKADRNFSILAATLPGEKKVCFWKLGTGKNIKNIFFDDSISGISPTLDNRFFVGNGKNGLYFIDQKRLEVVKRLAISDITLDGAHSKII